MDPSDLAQLNSHLLLDAICSTGTVTRGELAERLRLSPASVSRIVRSLLAEGSVEELPGDDGDPGRTPTRLRFVPRVGSVIAIDLGGTKCHGALADLAGGILHEDFRPTGGPVEAATTVLECLDVLRSLAKSKGMPVHAVVVGIPALIDPDTGLATEGPNIGWEGFDLLGALEDRVFEPVEVDNDANLAALGQAWRGEAVGVRSFVTLSLGTGIGGGVVIDGRLVRGLRNAAGEIGRLALCGSPLRSGRASIPDFEHLASGPALRARAAELVKRSPKSSLAGSDFDTAAVFEAAAAGDPVGKRVIEEFLGYVAIAIVNITAILDPELIILDGGVGRAIEPWLPSLVARVNGHVFRPPALIASKLGPNATVVGAIARGLALASESGNSKVRSIARTMFRPANALRERQETAETPREV
jgi:glucokinase